jgi:hypothetical protein
LKLCLSNGLRLLVMTFYQTPLLEGLKTAVSNNMNGIDDDVLLQEPTEENVVYW